MHARTREVLAYLDTQRAALADAVAAVPAELRGRRPAPDRWSVAEVLDHLAMVNGSANDFLEAQVASARAAGLGAEGETSPVISTFDPSPILDRSRKRTASERSQPRAGIDVEVAQAALARTQQALRDMLLDWDGLALSELILPNPVFGPLNVYQWVLFVGGHQGRHAAQIRELAAELQNGG
jgi:hypothetical protein